MTLRPLFDALADAFDGPDPIETVAARELRRADTATCAAFSPVDLPDSIRAVMMRHDAAPVCAAILACPLPWAAPTTSTDPDYLSHSAFKYSVELLGPDGLVHSDVVRLGLYGYVPHGDYGARRHPAEETFLMLAGEAWWMRDGAEYVRQGPGTRSYHPSMMSHGTRSGETGFMSAFVWYGDISVSDYVFSGGAARTSPA